MKKATLLLTALFALSAIVLPAVDANAQSRTRARGHVKKSAKRSHTKRSHTKRSHAKRSRSSHRSHHHTSHRSHRTHRSGVHVRFGWPYYSTHHGHYERRYRHHPHHSYRHTVVYDRTPNVIVVEADHGFTMPALECPIRTAEERSGFQQWCATGRGTKHGLFRRWYADGVLAAEGEYEADTKTGVWVEFHPNGAIREEGAYKNNARIGTWVTWGSDGEELVVVDY